MLDSFARFFAVSRLKIYNLEHVSLYGDKAIGEKVNQDEPVIDMVSSFMFSECHIAKVQFQTNLERKK